MTGILIDIKQEEIINVIEDFKKTLDKYFNAFNSTFAAPISKINLDIGG